MVVSVRAIYEQGHLRLLEPVDLTDGAEVNVTILPSEQELTVEEARARLRAAGVLVEYDDDEMKQGVELSAEERRRIGHLFVGNKPFSDLIDEDRGLY
jgi:predicted DNA-binding antitoxin AbrB/MazE fold protein